MQEILSCHCTAFKLSSCHQLNITSDAHCGVWQSFSFFLPMGDFITDDAAQFGVDLFLVFPMADAAKIEVGAIPDINQVIIRPAYKAVILVNDLHAGSKSLLAGLCNGLRHLAFLVAFGIVPVATTQRENAGPIGVLELPVRPLLPVERETRQPQVGDELADFTRHER